MLLRSFSRDAPNPDKNRKIRQSWRAIRTDTGLSRRFIGSPLSVSTLSRIAS